MRAKGRAGKPGAAAEIEHRAKAHGAAAILASRFDGGEQQGRRAIVEPLAQRPVEIARVLVEQRAHIARRHRAIARAEMRELQAGAVAVIRVGVARRAEGRDRAIRVARLALDLAEREPGRRKARRALDRLCQEIARGAEFAPRREVARKFIAAVGDEIAGRNKKRCGHSFNRHGGRAVTCGRIWAIDNFLMGSTMLPR